MTEDHLRDLLPSPDVEYLISKDLDGRVDVRRVGQETHILFRDYQFPAHYTPRTADLLVRLVPPYPNGNPDMFWTRPDVMLLSGGFPLNSAHHEVPAPSGHEAAYQSVPWQRWSRHLSGDRWRPGVDGLRSYMACVRLELEKGR